MLTRAEKCRVAASRAYLNTRVIVLNRSTLTGIHITNTGRLLESHARRAGTCRLRHVPVSHDVHGVQRGSGLQVPRSLRSGAIGSRLYPTGMSANGLAPTIMSAGSGPDGGPGPEKVCPGGGTITGCYFRCTFVICNVPRETTCSSGSFRGRVPGPEDEYWRRSLRL